MVKKSSTEIEEVKLFIATLINEEQDKHANLLSALRLMIGNTNECYNVEALLGKMYAAKHEVLEKVMKKVQEM
jgi:hypothetical protein